MNKGKQGCHPRLVELLRSTYIDVLVFERITGQITAEYTQKRCPILLCCDLLMMCIVAFLAIAIIYLFSF